VPPERCVAFAPGRVNLIGEHTDYNQGLALPFAIREGVTVHAQARPGLPARISALAQDLGESDEFPVDHPSRVEGWRAFVRGVVAELTRAGIALPDARLAISGQVPRGAGLSSSAAIEVALCLALIGLCQEKADEVLGPLDRTEIARLCARV
jgi:galactokinase